MTTLPEFTVFIQPVQKVICNDFNTNQMILEASCKSDKFSILEQTDLMFDDFPINLIPHFTEKLNRMT
jgi:hypothetical protein